MSGRLSGQMQEKSSGLVAFLFHWLALPLLLAIALQLPTYLDFGDKISGGTDALLFLHVFEDNLDHLRNILVVEPKTFWSPDYFWPMQNTKAWGDHMVLHTLIYGLFRTFFSASSSWTLWITALMLLNYISLRYCLGKISRFDNPYALSITSLAASYSPAVTELMAQPKMLGLFLVPPLLIYIHNIFNSKSALWPAKDLLAISILTASSLLITIYTFVFTSFGVICALITRLFYCLYARRDLTLALARHFLCLEKPIYYRIIKENRQQITGLLLLLSLIASIYIPYLKTIQTFGTRGFIDSMQLPQVGSILQGGNDLFLKAPSQLLPLPESLLKVTGHEQNLFPGYMFIALFIVAFVIQVFQGKLLSSTTIPINSTFPKEVAVQYLLYSVILWIGIINIGGTSLLSISALIIPGAKALRVPSRAIFIPIILSTPLILNGVSLSLSSSGNAGRPAKIISFKRFNLWILSIFLIIIFTFRSGFFGRFDYTDWKHSVSKLSEQVINLNCNLLYVMPNKDLHIGERHLLGMHVAQATTVPTLNGTNGYIPEFGYPYEDLENGADSAIALGWAIAQSQELYYEGSKPIKTPIRLCALDSQRNKADLLVSDDARYPSSPFFSKDFSVTRDSSNGLVVIQKKVDGFPSFHRIMDEKGDPEYIDIYGYSPSNIEDLGNGRIRVIDTPRGDLTGFNGYHARLIDLKSNTLIEKNFYPSKTSTN